MVDVLVITSQEKTRAVFSKAEPAAGCRVRIVPTMAQCEEEVAASLPTHVFAESTISGMTGSEVAHLLRRLLPPRTRIILLGTAPGGHGCETLDASLDDAALERALLSIIASKESTPQAVGAPAPEREGSARDLLFSSNDDQAEVPKAKSWKPVVYGSVVVAAVAMAAAAAHFTKASAPQVAAPPPRVAEGRPAPVPAPTPAVPDSTPAAKTATSAAPSPAAPPAGARQVRRVVRPGDTIWKILGDYGISEGAGTPLIPEIQRLNRLDDVKRLKPGQTLVLPVWEIPANK